MRQTVLLEHLAGRAWGAGCRVARAVGVQWAVELGFAGLHQLCAPMLDHVVQDSGAAAGRAADGVRRRGGPRPDQFLVRLAALSLLSEVAGDTPLIC